MKQSKFFMSVFVMVLLLALAVGFVLAQEPEPQNETAPDEVAAVNNIVPIQGRLTDADGNPLDGDHSIRASLYNADTGGTALCEDTDTVTVENGLFNMNMNWCTASDIDGKSLWLGIAVDGDSEMEPRQPIYPVPYAWSLRPGAQINESLDGSILSISNNSATGGTGLSAYSLAGPGVWGSSVGIGVKGTSLGGPGVYASASTGAALAVAGTGVITSTARSYLWISGNDIRPFHESDGVIIDADTIGGAKIYRGPNPGDKNVMLPITIVGPLYGQDVTLTELEIYFVGDSEFEGITAVLMRRQTGVCATSSCYKIILYDTTDHSCDDAVNPTGCTVSYSLTQNNVLTQDSGILYLTIELTFTGETTWVEIGGVRLTLEHD